MNNVEFVVIALVGLFVVVLLLAATVYWRKRRSRPEHTISCSDEDVDAMRQFEKVLEVLEKRFLAVALTEKMSELKVPFPIRDKVWEVYPCEYSDPVAGLSEIAQLAGLKYEQLYALLPRWYEKMGIVQSGGLDSEKIRSYLHDKAAIRVDAVLKEFL